jgi:hypothetical protein
MHGLHLTNPLLSINFFLSSLLFNPLSSHSFYILSFTSSLHSSPIHSSFFMLPSYSFISPLPYYSKPRKSVKIQKQKSKIKIAIKKLKHTAIKLRLKNEKILFRKFSAFISCAFLLAFGTWPQFSLIYILTFVCLCSLHRFFFHMPSVGLRHCTYIRLLLHTPSYLLQFLCVCLFRVCS